MGFPLINKQPMRTINIPELSGGINLRDAIYSVNDNQLTDCKNVWFKDGTLKTRPGIKTIKTIKKMEGEEGEGGIISKDYEATITSEKMWDIYREFDGVKCQLYSVAYGYNGDIDGQLKDAAATQFEFLPVEMGLLKENGSEIATFNSGSGLFSSLQSQSDRFASAAGSATVSKIAALDFRFDSGFVVEKGNDIYLFRTNVAVEGDENKKCVEVYKLASDYLSWSKLGKEDMYIPTIYTDCKCNKDGLKDFDSAPGEAHNLLCDRIKVQYSTVNYDLLDASDTESTHNMQYYIPFDYTDENKRRLLTDFSVKVMYADGKECEHKFNYTNGADTFEEDILKEGYSLPVDGFIIKGWTRREGSIRLSFFKVEIGTNGKPVTQANEVTIYVLDGSTLKEQKVTRTTAKSTIHTVKASDYIRNNMVVTVPVDMSEDEDRFARMTFCTNYGGSSEGIFGGTRTIVAGSEKAEDKACMMWSDLNNPLYWPMDCEQHVGRESEAITGFGKQNEQLIIFKERSVWGSNYVFNSNITGEELIAQTVVNYEANIVSFPLIELHSEIGCRAPYSIRLCNNRLVWADINGVVYTLVSQNQYSEKNIYIVSQMVERELKNCLREDFASARACEYQNHYLLCVGRKIFVMDYGTYGFQKAYAYPKNEDAQKLIPWWIWELSDKVFLHSCSNELFALTKNAVNRETTEGAFIETQLNWNKFGDYDTDNGEKIESVIATKAYNFSSFQFLKQIPTVNIALRGNGEIRVEYISDKPELCEEEIISIYSDDVENKSPQYVKNILLRPNMRFTALFGMRISSDTGLVIGPVSLNYRLLGVNK